ncbi:MAG TPA: chemotaxis protein CheX [Terriglobales bacterium]|nr:chemotaxis protein CheX [Terriglobales bacterium]
MKSVTELLPAKDGRSNWVPLLETATREVFELMLSSQLSPSINADESNLNVTAMVGLAGQLCGVLSVRCDDKAARLMTSKMLGVDLDKVGPEISDALGEVCNMVAGNFKNKIAGLAEGCMLSPPTVITGSDYSLHSMADSPALEIRLQFETMPLVISLLIQS